MKNRLQFLLLLVAAVLGLNLFLFATSRVFLLDVEEPSVEQAIEQHRRGVNYFLGWNLVVSVPATLFFFLAMDRLALARRREEEGEARFRTLMERMNDAYFLVAPDGRLLDFNERACGLLGHERRELARKRWPELLPSPCRESGCQGMAGDFTGLAAVHSCQLLAADGRYLPVEINAGCIEENGRRLVFYLVRDIRERQDAENRLRQSEQRFRSVFENAALGMCTLSPEGEILQANREACRIIGYAEDELRGMRVQDLTHPDDLELTRRHYEQGLKKGAHFSYQKRYVRKDGGIVWGHASVAWVTDGAGRPEFGIGLLQDLTARRAAEDRAEQLANFDPLTGLPNRGLFQQRLGAELEQSVEEDGRALAVMYIDLDRFKRINDTVGYGAGDAILQQVAQRLLGVLRSGETAARLGGDKFALLLNGLTEPEEVGRFAQDVLGELTQPYDFEGVPYALSASVGIAMAPMDGADVESLLKSAEIAMYQVKESGRNGYQFYSIEIHARAVYGQMLETYLMQALERDELELHYQPQLSLEGGRLVGMEALMRWESPALGKIPPDKFIPLAEESDLILRLGEWALRTACRQAGLWQAAGFPELRMAVNVSGRQFRRPDFAEQVSAILQETGLAPQCLELELTESCLVDNPQEVRKILHRLRTLGVHVAVDDFGTGYSSLSYLKLFPLNRIKIDRSFVRDVDSDADDAAIVSAIIAMAHSLGMEVIAEGVETENHLEFLRQRRCNEVQGYYYSKPLPVADVAAFLDQCREARGELRAG
ncbi:putative bifunctional diguanylate cyclase/phosphodiesterase [Geoalkalibacter sp.]|uniref:putative bifunctional diguanylate cyclase/phosphodiesterase n=1 Tax=Geoalkalibacter sp. TaxID=3041440 RepID=UPI00272E9553|nr:EAL domain-containing protein [Geoalkalibacter sp.]